jgi:hypothetical protein
MIRMMKIVFGLLLSGLLSCGDEISDASSFNDDLSIITLNGTWKVISFEDLTTNTVEYKTPENSWDKDIIVTFDDKMSPKLLSGTVTTNSVQGEFEYVGLRGFKINHYGTTYVAQPKWADKFGTAVLDNSASFKINSDRLRIYYGNNSKSVTLTKEK